MLLFAWYEFSDQNLKKSALLFQISNPIFTVIYVFHKAYCQFQDINNANFKNLNF